MPAKGDKTTLVISAELSKEFDKSFKSAIKSINQLSQRAQVVDNALKRMGANTRHTANVIKKTGEASERAAKQSIGLANSTKKTADNSMLQSQASKDLNSQLKNTSKNTKESTGNFKKMGYQITFVAWHIRFLGGILQQISQKLITTFSEWIKTGAEMQDRFFGLATSAAVYGQSSSEARKAAEGLAKKGLVPLTTATEAYNNVLLTGAFNVEESTDFLEKYLDVATLITAGQEEMANSLTFFTQSILRGTMVLGTDVTARALWAVTQQRVNKELGINLSQLSAERRAKEAMITLTEDFNQVLGLHEVRMQLLSSNITKMNESYQVMKLVLAESLWPAVIMVSDAFVKATTVVGNLIEKTGILFPAIALGTIVTLTFVAAILSLTGILLSFGKISEVLTGVLLQKSRALQLSALSANSFSISLTNLRMSLGLYWYQLKLATTATGFFAKAKLIAALAVRGFAVALRWAFPLLLALDVVMIGISASLLKSSGAASKQANAINEIEEAIRKLDPESLKDGGFFGEAADEDEDALKKSKLAHTRRVDDLEEELNREISKGLWADQIKIKNLEKQLSREKQDWDLYLRDREKQTNESSNLFGKMTDDVNKLGETFDDTITNINSSWDRFWSSLTLDSIWKTIRDSLEKIGEKAKKAWKWFDELKKESPILAAAIATLLLTAIVPLSNILIAVLPLLVKFANPWVFSLVIPTAATIAIAELLKSFRELNELLGPGMEKSADVFNNTLNRAKKAFENGEITAEEYNDVLRKLIQSQKDSSKEMDTLEQRLRPGSIIMDGLSRLGNYLSGGYGPLVDISKISMGNSFGFQTGSIQVPGKLGQPTPAILHGGERIIPAHETSSFGSGDTIIINNPSVRNDDDIQKLANTVLDALSKKQKWARLGGFPG